MLYKLFQEDNKINEVLEKTSYLKKEIYILSKKCLLNLSEDLMKSKQISESEYFIIKRTINKSLKCFKNKKSLEELIRIHENLLKTPQEDYTKEIIKRSIELDRKFIRT